MGTFKIGQRVRLTRDVPLVGNGGTLPAGAMGTVIAKLGTALEIYRVTMDANEHRVLFHVRQIEAVDEAQLAKGQLAARDAALDAVLALAREWQDGVMSDGLVTIRSAGKKLVEMLDKLGVR